VPDYQDHIARLRGDVDVHVRRLAELHELIRRAEEEAAVHEALIALARNDHLLAAAARHQEDPDAVLALVGDRQETRDDEGIPLPDSVTIDLVAADKPSSRVTGHLRCGGWDVEIGWEPERGFFAIPDTRRLRQMRAVVNFVHTIPVGEEAAGAPPASSGTESASDSTQRTY
jgi:hypothetical protein